MRIVNKRSQFNQRYRLLSSFGDCDFWFTTLTHISLPLSACRARKSVLYLHISRDVFNVTEARDTGVPDAWPAVTESVAAPSRPPPPRDGATPTGATYHPPPPHGPAHLYAKLSLNFVQLSAD